MVHGQQEAAGAASLPRWMRRTQETRRVQTHAMRGGPVPKPVAERSRAGRLTTAVQHGVEKMHTQSAGGRHPRVRDTAVGGIARSSDSATAASRSMCCRDQPPATPHTATALEAWGDLERHVSNNEACVPPGMGVDMPHDGQRQFARPPEVKDSSFAARYTKRKLFEEQAAGAQRGQGARNPRSHCGITQIGEFPQKRTGRSREREKRRRIPRTPSSGVHGF